MKSPGEWVDLLNSKEGINIGQGLEAHKVIAAAQAEAWNAALKKAATLANRRTRLSRDAKDGQLAREILALQKEPPQ
jgi:hypothetical protein